MILAPSGGEAKYLSDRSRRINHKDGQGTVDAQKEHSEIKHDDFGLIELRQFKQRQFCILKVVRNNNQDVKKEGNDIG